MKLIKRSILLWILLMVLPLSACAASGTDAMAEHLIKQFQKFNRIETLQTNVVNKVMYGQASMYVPAQVLEAAMSNSDFSMFGDGVTGISGGVVMHDPSASDKKMITDFTWSEYRYPIEEKWTAFEAGERAGGRLYEMYHAGNVMEIDGRLPVNRQLYNDLTGRCGGGLSIIGLDSAYMYGETPYSEDITITWEAWPFFIVDYDNTVFENTFYVYFRMIIDVDEYTEEALDYIIADREAVSELYGHMLNLNQEIESNDREAMIWYIDAIRAMNNTAVKQTPAPDVAGPFVWGDYEAYSFGDGTCEITDYTGSAKNLAIPEELNGKRVVRLAERSFEGCLTLESVTIPDSVVGFGYSAFMGCANLKEVHIPATVEKISNNMFADCRSLEEITIPDSVKEIVSFAFAGCSSLEDMEIPASVTVIDESAFCDCTSLSSIAILGKDTILDSYVFDGCWSLRLILGYTGSPAEECAYVYGLSFEPIDTVPVSTPAPAAMLEPKPTKIPLPYKALNAKKYVSGDYAYADMGDGTCVITNWSGTKSNLKIPEKLNGKKVVGIGYEAFTEYNRDPTLSSVTIPEGVTILGSSSFFYCEKLEKVTIPDSVTTIEEGAFDSCSSLKEVTIPRNVTYIGAKAFSWCYSLKSVTIYSENAVFAKDYMDKGPFADCKNLEEIRGYAGSTAEMLAKECGVRFVPLSQGERKDDKMASGSRKAAGDMSVKTYKKGDKGKEVKEIKRRLQELGYYSASAELGSEFNDTMVSKVKRYQEDQGLKQTGRIDEDTYRSLMLTGE